MVVGRNSEVVVERSIGPFSYEVGLIKTGMGFKVARQSVDKDRPTILNPETIMRSQNIELGEVYELNEPEDILEVA